MCLIHVSCASLSQGVDLDLCHLNSGVELTEASFTFFSIRDILDLSKKYASHIHIWQVSLQLSCGDTCQILMWYWKGGSVLVILKKIQPESIWNWGNWYSDSHPWTIIITYAIWCLSPHFDWQVQELRMPWRPLGCSTNEDEVPRVPRGHHYWLRPSERWLASGCHHHAC